MTPQIDAGQQVRATVLRCWCETLGVPEHEVTDSSNFFDYGSSVLAIQFLSATSAALGVEVPVDPLFLDGTFGEFVQATMEADNAR
jgi:Phosphopantetheine attachment site